MQRQPAEQELAEHFTVAPDEMALVVGKSGTGKLGFALMLKLFQQDGRFPTSLAYLPENVVRYVARQLNVGEASLGHYDTLGRSGERHRAAIRKFTRFREFADKDVGVLTKWLTAQALENNDAAPSLTEKAYQRLREMKIEPPAPEPLDRLVRSALHGAECLVAAPRPVGEQP